MAPKRTSSRTSTPKKPAPKGKKAPVKSVKAPTFQTGDAVQVVEHANKHLVGCDGIVVRVSRQVVDVRLSLFGEVIAKSLKASQLKSRKPRGATRKLLGVGPAASSIPPGTAVKVTAHPNAHLVGRGGRVIAVNGTSMEVAVDFAGEILLKTFPPGKVEKV